MPEAARRALGCSTGAVYLSKETAKHILDRHPDIDMFKILLLPIAITKGRLLREIKRPQIIISIYHENNDKTYLVAMKSAQNGHELWVSSMHRLANGKKLLKSENVNPSEREADALGRSVRQFRK